MPTYAYKCFDCGHQFEEVQKMSEPPISICPSCGKNGNVKRLISATAFHLKGSGWYKTDYAAKGAGDAGNAGGAANSDLKSGAEGATAEGSAEKKPAESKPGAQAEKQAENKADSKADKNAEKRESAPKTEPPAAAKPSSSGSSGGGGTAD